MNIIKIIVFEILIWILARPVLGPIFRWLASHSVDRVKAKFRGLLQQRIEIQKSGEGEVHEGYSYKPIAFPLYLDCKALFDEISVQAIRCIFSWKDVPLQGMWWEKGDNWATNWTVPQVPDKLPLLGKCGVTLFFNPTQPFLLWAEVEEIDRKRLLHTHEVNGTLQKLREEVIFPDERDNWSIDIRITFSSMFGDFTVSRKLRKISVKQDWRAICHQVRSIYDALGIKRLPSI